MALKGKLVFSSGRAVDYDIWCLEISSGQLTQLTRGSDLNEFPRWSPDGSQIAYISTGDDFVRSLCIMDADGSNQRRLTSKMFCQHPSWAPDGKSLLFTANALDPNEIDICRYDLQSNKHEVLLHRKGEESAPSFSPDGKQIIFSAVDHNSDAPFAKRDTDIWEYNLLTKKETKLFSHPARDFDPVYSPNGSQIAFASYRNERSEAEYLSKLEDLKSQANLKDRRSVDKLLRDLFKYERDTDIYVADCDGKNIRKLTSNEGADQGVRWSPCGNYLVYAAAPMGKGAQERLKVIEVSTGKLISLDYNRQALMEEINANPDHYANDRLFWHLVPNFIEHPFRARFLGTCFFGEEHHPDWTYAL